MLHYSWQWAQLYLFGWDAWSLCCNCLSVCLFVSDVTIGNGFDFFDRGQPMRGKHCLLAWKPGQFHLSSFLQHFSFCHKYSFLLCLLFAVCYVKVTDSYLWTTHSLKFHWALLFYSLFWSQSDDIQIPFLDVLCSVQGNTNLWQHPPHPFFVQWRYLSEWCLLGCYAMWLL
jgi:hypothetical protein